MYLCKIACFTALLEITILFLRLNVRGTIPLDAVNCKLLNKACI